MKNLDSFFLMNGLSVAERRQIISGLSPAKTFSKGQAIYSSEHFANAIGYMISGSATASTANRTGMTMRKFTAGMSFGAAALFGEGEQYVSLITADSACTVQFVFENELKALFKAYPETAVNYITFLSEKVRFLNNRLDVISCGSAEESVLRHLISVSDENGYVRLPKSMTALAKMLGLGRASLYRSFDALERSGAVLRQNNQLKVVKDGHQNEKNT